jgi:hypothetical protein
MLRIYQPSSSAEMPASPSSSQQSANKQQQLVPAYTEQQLYQQVNTHLTNSSPDADAETFVLYNGVVLEMFTQTASKFRDSNAVPMTTPRMIERNITMG